MFMYDPAVAIVSPQNAAGTPLPAGMPYQGAYHRKEPNAEGQRSQGQYGTQEESGPQSGQQRCLTGYGVNHGQQQ